jgi:hypothetical protein
MVWPTPEKTRPSTITEAPQLPTRAKVALDNGDALSDYPKTGQAKPFAYFVEEPGPSTSGERRLEEFDELEKPAHDALDPEAIDFADGNTGILQTIEDGR